MCVQTLRLLLTVTNEYVKVLMGLIVFLGVLTWTFKESDQLSKTTFTRCKQILATVLMILAEFENGRNCDGNKFLDISLQDRLVSKSEPPF